MPKLIISPTLLENSLYYRRVLLFQMVMCFDECDLPLDTVLSSFQKVELFPLSDGGKEMCLLSWACKKQLVVRQATGHWPELSVQVYFFLSDDGNRSRGDF